MATGVDTVPALVELARHPNLWDQNTIRTKHEGTAHADASDILVWFNREDDPDIINSLDVVAYPAWRLLPAIRALVLSVLRELNAVRLGRVVISRLPAGGEILPHIDQGAPAKYYDRVHVVLQAVPGVKFRCGTESVEVHTGEVWWFNNQLMHEIQNNSGHDRVVLIIDAHVE